VWGREMCTNLAPTATEVSSPSLHRLSCQMQALLPVLAPALLLLLLLLQLTGPAQASTDEKLQWASDG
jgi:hypothetical protein